MKSLLAVVLALVTNLAAAASEGYDPLALPESAKVIIQDVEFEDSSRSRKIPLRLYFNEHATEAPTILFSHGLGGSRENNRYLGNHWAARGYVVIVMQHAGSDDSVWKGVPLGQMRTALNRAASRENSIARNADVPATLDQLAAWNSEEGHFLSGRIDMESVGMSGHSFGAITTQAVSGQTFGPAGARFTDERIDAAIAFSPSPPPFGDPAPAFAQVKIPWLLMTGTEDESPVGRTTPETRLEVYPHLPEGGKYELVLDGAKHMAFSDRTLRRGGQRNPNHHRSILAFSTAFWDSYLKEDPAAKAWLDGDGARDVLQENDRWQRK